MLSSIVSVVTFVTAAEIGGLVLDSRSSEAFPSPVPVTVSLYGDEGMCVAEALADVGGRYVLEASPGHYLLRIVVGQDEVVSERVKLSSMSVAKSYPVSVPWTQPKLAPTLLGRQS